MARKKARKPQRRTMIRLHSRRIMSDRALRGAGIAVTAIGGALVMVFSAPVASADGSLEPTIDQILADMQAAVTADSALPYATPANDAMLPAGLQNAEFELMMQFLGSQTSSNVPIQLPEQVAGDAANVRQMFAFDNPDTYYTYEPLTQGASYVLTGDVGAGSGDLAINDYSSSGASVGIGPGLELNNGLVVNPDGSFSVDIGPTEPSGAVNYINDTGGTDILIRDTLDNWALGSGTGTFSLECTADCPAASSGLTGTGPSSAEISSLLNVLALETTGYNKLVTEIGATGGILLPADTMSPLESEAIIPGGLPSEVISEGNFQLQPDQALIVKVPDVTAPYQGIELESVFGQTLPHTLEQTSLNSTQVFSDPDGYTYYVISATNPGVANWLDSGNLDAGQVFARFQGLSAGEASDVTGQQVTTEVVPVADVSQYLPADTPTVTPAEYAADMSARVLSADYALDSSRTSGWVTQELALNDLQAAMGTSQFDNVFGTEPSTPMWLRLTPALSPNEATLVKDILADPSGSLTAIQDNLPLAEKDIELPITLAQTLLQQDFTQTAQAVQGDLSSGDLTQALTALEAGDQQLGSILNGALFDPNTSITAGILNARDDLATAILTADGGFPSQAGPLATLEWSDMSQLAQLTPSTVASDLSSLLNPATSASDLSAVLTDLSAVLNPADFATLLDPAAISSSAGGLAAELSTMVLSFIP